jgi:hypothetical protein
MRANVQCAAEVHIRNVSYATRGYVSELGERDVKLHYTMILCSALLDATFWRC